MTKICIWCKTNAGRTHGDRPCCQLRALAQAPRHVQAEYAKGLTQEQREALRPRLAAEIKRLKALQAKVDHDRVTQIEGERTRQAADITA